ATGPSPTGRRRKPPRKSQYADQRVAARAGKDVHPGTMAVVRSPDFLRALIRETALATLIHQRRLTPSCGGHAPTAERTVGPARMIAESLTPKPGIREHNRGKADISGDAGATLNKRRPLCWKKLLSDDRT